MNAIERLPEQPAETGGAMVSMIERVVMDPNASIEKLERMLDMRDRMNAEAAKAQFAAAFAAAAAEFPSIPLNGVGHNNKPYATLKDIITHTRPALSANGLVLSFSASTTSDRVVVTAELMHRAGYTKSTSMELPKDVSGSKNAVQAIGSSQTYGQRYTAQAILGLSLGDDTEDDGKAAENVKRINADQYVALQNLVEETQADIPRLLKFLRAETLEELTLAQFDTAMSALRKKAGAK